MKFINKYKSLNYDLRKKNCIIKHIVIHYTAMRSDLEAVKHLCNIRNKVSSHFLINKLGEIYSLVNIRYRAWHAGKSYWNKEEDINSTSIGIELENSGHFLDFEDYSNLQIDSLCDLLIFLKQKYKIQSHNILGHSDIAPYRKYDPGEKFPWKKLHLNKIIKIPLINIEKNLTKDDVILNEPSIILRKTKALNMLKIIGYDVVPAYINKKNFMFLVRAYQMHYRQDDVSGVLDRKTFEIIKNQYNQSLTY